MPAKRLVYIGNKLQGKGSNVTTIETLSTQLTTLGYEVHAYSSKKNKVLRLLNMLYGVCKKGAKATAVLIDTYSTQNFYYAVAVGNLCRLMRIPYIPILHGGDLPNRLQKSKSNSYKLFHGAKVNVAPSEYLMEAFTAEGYANITYIPNTIEISNYPFLLRKNIQPRLLWVRSFAEIYNPFLAIEVLESVLKKYPKASLCMIGPAKDSSYEWCKAYVKKHRLPVTFTGKLTKNEWIAKSTNYDIFINTTNFDNMPVSVIEAMALGLPVVSTHVGGMPYLIEDGTTGLLVPPQDEEAMSKKVRLLLKNPILAESLSIQARKKAENYDWEIVKQDWKSLLGE